VQRRIAGNALRESRGSGPTRRGLALFISDYSRILNRNKPKSHPNTQTHRLFFAYRRRRFSGNRRYNTNHDSGQRVPDLAHGRSEPSFLPIPLPSRYPYPPVPSSPAPPPLPYTGDPLQRRHPGLPASLLRADSRPHLRRNRAAVAVSEGAPAAPLFAVQSRRPHTDSSIQTPLARKQHASPPIRRVTSQQSRAFS